MRSTELDITGTGGLKRAQLILGLYSVAGAYILSHCSVLSLLKMISLYPLFWKPESLPPPVYPCEGKLGSKRFPGRDNPKLTPLYLWPRWMKRPRCGVPDQFGVRVKANLRRRRKRYTLTGKTWNNYHLTFRYGSGFDGCDSTLLRGT